MRATTDFDSGGGVDVAVDERNGNVTLTLTDGQDYAHHGYFHFRLSGVAGTEVSFEVTNLSESRMPGDHRLFYATDVDDPDWRRVDESVGGGCTHTFATDDAYVSNYRAYPYGTIVDRVNELAEERFVETDVFGRSYEGRDMHAVRVTDPAVDDRDKRDFVCLTRQHPGEVQGSYHLDAVVDHVLERFRSGRGFETDYVFHFLPDANPDGIYHGIHRRDPRGNDLNRSWGEDSPVEVENLKGYLRDRVSDLRRGIDFHATTNETYAAALYRNGAVDGAALPTIEAVADHSASLSGIEGAGDAGRSRDFVYDEFGGMVLTVEAWTYHEYSRRDLEDEAVGFFRELVDDPEPTVGNPDGASTGELSDRTDGSRPGGPS